MKTIGIIARQNQPAIIESFDTLTQFLKKHRKTIYLDDKSIAIARQTSFNTLPSQELAKQCDLIIVIGGDGSFLHAAHDILDSKTPMVGINRGKLGFLTDINPENIEKDLEAILNNRYQIEKRFLLQSNYQDKMVRALNEVVLSANSKSSMIEFEVFIDDVFLLREKSDGMIFATPTGSTAYALSGGGPILHPELNSIVLVPMFSHTLSSRPIVMNADHIIKINILEKSGVISLDGSSLHSINENESFTIKKHPTPLNLIHPAGYDYFDALRTKLHWGRRTGQ